MVAELKISETIYCVRCQAGGMPARVRVHTQIFYQQYELSVTKASNSSNIFNSILQLLMHEITSILLSLFNKCYDTEYCSKTFKNSITIILRKSKNIDSEKKSRDYQKNKSYRSIALLKTLKKTLKLIITRKITYITEKHTLLSENHMKERRCKSTKHVVHALIKFIIIS